MARGTHYSAFESVTVDGSPVGLTAATIAGQNEALITVETAAVRFTLDGTTVTPVAGHELEVGDELDIDSSEAMELVSFVRRDGVDAMLRCSYGN